MANALGNIGSAVLGGLKGGAEALAAHSPGYNQFKQNQARDMAIDTQKMERWIKIAKDPSFSRDLRVNSLMQAFDTKPGKILLNRSTISLNKKWAEKSIDKMDQRSIIPKDLLAGGVGDRTSISYKDPATGATIRRSGSGKERQYQTVWFDKSGKKKTRLVPESQYANFQSQIEASGGTLNEPDSLEDQYRFWTDMHSKAKRTDSGSEQTRLMAQALGQEVPMTEDVEGVALANKKLAEIRAKMGTRKAKKIDEEIGVGFGGQFGGLRDLVNRGQDIPPTPLPPATPGTPVPLSTPGQTPATKTKGKSFVVDTYPPPQTKGEFDRTLASITDEAEKDRWFELHYKPEYGKQK